MVLWFRIFDYVLDLLQTFREKISDLLLSINDIHLTCDFWILKILFMKYDV